MENFLYVLAGIIFIFGGLHLIINKTIPHSLQIDFEGIAQPLGVFTILLGIALIVSVIRKSK